MKSNNAWLLACAVAATLAISGCHNDNGTDQTSSSQASSSADSDTTPTAPSSAMTPASNSSAATPTGSPMSSNPMSSNAMSPDSAAAASTSAGNSVALAGELTFDQMDKNHDGFITIDEVPDIDPLKKHFTEADTHHDGKLTREELNRFRANEYPAASTSMTSPSS